MAHRRDLVGLRAHLDLPEDQAACVLHGGHHHAPFALDLLRGTAHILAIKRNGCALLAVLGNPLAQGPVQGIGRQGGQDVMEGRRRGRGIALAAGAPERAERLELVVIEPGGELAKGRHTAIAGKTGRDHDRHVARDAVTLTAPFAEVGEDLEKGMQSAQGRGRYRLVLRSKLPLGRFLRGAKRLAGLRFKCVHVDLLGLPVLAPARRPARHPRKAPRQAQPAPIRRPIAGPRKARRVHEGLGQHHRKAVPCPHVVRHTAHAQGKYPRGQVGNPPPVRQHHETAVVGDQMQPGKLLLAVTSRSTHREPRP